MCGINSEDADYLRRIDRLVLQRFGSSGGLFHQRSILLCHGIHFGDGLIDLFDACFLLPADRGDFAHEIGVMTFIFMLFIRIFIVSRNQHYSA